MKIETKFDVWDSVRIPELDKTLGRIRSIRVSMFGVEYLVAYFNNGKREEEFFLEDDLIRDAERPRVNRSSSSQA